MTPGTGSLLPSRAILLFLAGWLIASLPAWFIPDNSLAGDLEEQLDAIVEQTAPGIVSVDVRRPWSTYGSDSFDEGKAGLPVHRIQGSGVVWDREGSILTAVDLAQPGDTLHIWGADGVVRPAVFVAQDPELAVSLIRITPTPQLTPIPLGPSSPLSNRGWVFTIGYQAKGPARYAAANRIRGKISLSTHWRARLDAVLDPGIAGGGVLDEYGHLIGLLLGEGSTSLLLASGGRRSPVEYCTVPDRFSDLGWVLPIDQAAASIESLKVGSKGKTGFLGVRTELPGEGRTAPRPRGIPVAEVIHGSPADRAGIRTGDWLTSFEGSQLDDWDELTDQVRTTHPGQDVRVGLRREGKTILVQIRLADRGHVIWLEKQRRIAGGREKMLRRQIEGLKHELELVRHQLAAYR